MNFLLKYMVGCLLAAGSLQVASGQSCPDNIDFERGSFMGWDLAFGNVTALNGENEIQWIGYSADPTRHQILGAPDTTTDFYGKFPRLRPGGGKYSVVLGNDQTGGQAERISYDFTVPSNVTDYSIFFYYAVVLEDPNHTTIQQPRFRARIINLATGEQIDCVNFDFTASGSLPGFQYSTVKPSVLYKNWTPITIDLTAFKGDRLRLEFITSDCTLQGHFGYAYVDVSSICNGAVSGTIICEGDPMGTLTAPFGFSSYTWYADASFTSVISTDQFLTLTPPPPAGAVFPVVLEPFPGFGCRDTVFAAITSSPKPVAFAGDNRTICTYESTQLGKPPEPGMNYSWQPANRLYGPAAANPLTLPGLTGPTVFRVTVTDAHSGCTSQDDVVVTPVIIDTSMLVEGDLVFCKDGIKNTSLKVVTPGESIRWLGNNQLIAGATALQYDPRPMSTTSYFAEIWKQGCRDSTREVTVVIPADPSVSFKPERKLQCVQIPVTFLNTSTIPDGTLSYVWRLVNGDEYTTKDLTVVFNSPGFQAITLKATSDFGCTDSITQVFEFVENCHVGVPSAFTPNGDGLNDIFKPTLNGIKTLKRFAVYDRWGNVLYQTRELEAGWDGRSKGVLMDTGVYIWMLEYDSFDRDGVVLKGTITLIR